MRGKVCVVDVVKSGRILVPIKSVKENLGANGVPGYPVVIRRFAEIPVADIVAIIPTMKGVVIELPCGVIESTDDYLTIQTKWEEEMVRMKWLYDIEKESERNVS